MSTAMHASRTLMRRSYYGRSTSASYPCCVCCTCSRSSTGEPVLPLLLWQNLTLRTRVNISNAALFGLKTDLNLTGTKYNNALVVL